VRGGGERGEGRRGRIERERGGGGEDNGRGGKEEMGEDER